MAQHAAEKPHRKIKQNCPSPKLLCQSISRSFCWDLWHHMWEGRKWHFAHFWARRMAENNRSSNTYLLRINMSQTGKQSSGHRLIKSLVMSPCWRRRQWGRGRWWSKSGVSVNPSLTQHFPVTCVIVNANPPLTLIYHKSLYAPSVAVCFFVPLTPQRCQHWVYSFKGAFAHSLHHNCISAGWGCLATGQHRDP